MLWGTPLKSAQRHWSCGRTAAHKLMVICEKFKLKAKHVSFPVSIFFWCPKVENVWLCPSSCSALSAQLHENDAETFCPQCSFNRLHSMQMNNAYLKDDLFFHPSVAETLKKSVKQREGLKVVCLQAPADYKVLPETNYECITCVTAGCWWAAEKVCHSHS